MYEERTLQDLLQESLYYNGKEKELVFFDERDFEDYEYMEYINKVKEKMVNKL